MAFRHLESDGHFTGMIAQRKVVLFPGSHFDINSGKIEALNNSLS